MRCVVLVVCVVVVCCSLFGAVGRSMFVVVRHLPFVAEVCVLRCVLFAVRCLLTAAGCPLLIGVCCALMIAAWCYVFVV